MTENNKKRESNPILELILKEKTGFTFTESFPSFAMSKSALSDITLGSLHEFGTTFDTSLNDTTSDPYLWKKDSAANRLFDYLNGTELHKTDDCGNVNVEHCPTNSKRMYNQPDHLDSICEGEYESSKIDTENMRNKDNNERKIITGDQKEENDIEEGNNDLIFEIEL